jgi:TonB family protein
MGLNRFFLCVLAGVLIHMLAPGTSLAQQISQERVRRISDGIEAYYKAHPEMRPEVAPIAVPAAFAKAVGNCSGAVYPKEALRAEIQGKVELEFLIDIDGSVADSRITKSSGSTLLDTAAIEGLSKCRFIPQSKDGTAIPAWLGVRYIFALG